MIIPTLWHSLHDQEAYPDPYKFNPNRWSRDGIAEQHPKYSPSSFLTTETGLSSAQVHTSVSAKITP